MLKFRYIFEIKKYIQVAYLEFRDKQQMYFQAQFIRLKTEAIDMLSIFSKHKNSIRRKNYQKNSTKICKKKEIYSENIGTPLHEKLKAKKRLHYEQVCARKNKSPAQGYGNTQSKRKVRELYLEPNTDSQIVSDFKTQIKEGPYNIFVLFTIVAFIKNQLFHSKIGNYGDVNAVPFSLAMSYDGH